MDFVRFKIEFENAWEEGYYGHMRKGQLLMNFLAETDFELYQKVTYMQRDDMGNYIDCFYSDVHIDTTLDFLESNWRMV